MKGARSGGYELIIGVDVGLNKEMNVVHPVGEVPTTEADEAPPARVRMKNIQGMPGTAGGLVLRISQFVFATTALAVMVTTSDFASVTAFW